MNRDFKFGRLTIHVWTGWRAMLSFGSDGWIGRDYIQIAFLLPAANITLTLDIS